jgi:hypothetical protein
LKKQLNAGSGEGFICRPLTWLLPQALKLALAHCGPVQSGGTAVNPTPDFLADVAAVGGAMPGGCLAFHDLLPIFSSNCDIVVVN